jgi:hypothetical protein
MRAMPAEQLIAFAIWLVLAIAGGALIVFVWQRLRAKYGSGDAPPADSS